MNPTLLSSPLATSHAPFKDWPTPARAKVRLLRKQGLSYSQISNATGLTRSIIQGIVKAKSSRRSRKGKEYCINQSALHLEIYARLYAKLSQIGRRIARHSAGSKQHSILMHQPRQLGVRPSPNVSFSTLVPTDPIHPAYASMTALPTATPAGKPNSSAAF